MNMWTIYAKPTDNPVPFVLRRWQLGHDGKPRPDVGSSAHSTLEEAREAVPPGLVCFPRSPDDDPIIVETWL